MTKRPTKKAKKTARRSRPMTARRIDDAVSNATDRMVVGTIADGLKAGGVVKRKGKRGK